MTLKFIAIGDLHSTVSRLDILDAAVPAGVPFLQVGDLGIYPREKAYFERWGRSAQRRLYWIKGNHEYFPDVPLYAEEPVEVLPNIWYVPGGHVLELNGLRIGCLGGAASIDRARLTPGVDWWPEENILPSEEARAWAWSNIHMMVTHTPPQHVINTHFSRLEMSAKYEVDYGWVDENARLVGKLWAGLGCPPLICGHMHKAVRHDNIRILEINEALEVGPRD